MICCFLSQRLAMKSLRFRKGLWFWMMLIAYEFSLSFDGPKVERNAQNALTSSYLPAPHPISNSTLLSIITYLFLFQQDAKHRQEG